MAHYYARIKGNAGEATRRGYKNSGISARADSWTVGARISIDYNEQLNADIVTLYATTGSDDNCGKHIMSYTIMNNELKIIDTIYPELLL